MSGKLKTTKMRAQKKEKSTASPSQSQKPARKGQPSTSKALERVESPSEGGEDEDVVDGEEEREEVDPDEEDPEEDEDSEDEGVDEEGMQRLMKALGEDGLDDFGRASLAALAGEEGEVEDSQSEREDEEQDRQVLSDEEEHAEPAEEDEEENAWVSDEKEEAIPLDEVDEVDEDVVPLQKIEIDNKVRKLVGYAMCMELDHATVRLHWSGYEIP